MGQSNPGKTAAKFFRRTAIDRSGLTESTAATMFYKA